MDKTLPAAMGKSATGPVRALGGNRMRALADRWWAAHMPVRPRQIHFLTLAPSKIQQFRDLASTADALPLGSVLGESYHLSPYLTNSVLFPTYYAISSHPLSINRIFLFAVLVTQRNLDFFNFLLLSHQPLFESETVLFRSPSAEYPQHKMALDRKADGVADDSNNITSFDEKREPHRDPPFETGVYGYDVEKTEARGRKMSRLGGPSAIGITDTDDDSVVSVGKQVEMEASNAIKYRTCSWQKTAALLFSEYICLAIMSFPYSYSVLGIVPGLIVTVVVALFVLYTSLIVWEFCLRHPEIRDVCDLGQMLYYGWTWVWYGTAAMFLLNNTFIQGLHVLTGAKYLNTMTDGAVCTIGFSAVVAVISWICSLPRTFDTLSKIATLSAFTTFLSVLLAAIFAGLEDHPKGYNTGGPSGTLVGEPKVLVVAASGTTFVSGMNAFLNISYTFIGQITIPSFIAEMKEPKDFPKALYAVTIAEIIVFSVVGAVIYAFTGTQYNTAPAFGSLGNETYLKVSFSFMIPTLIFLGVLYASVSARFVFFRIFEGTRHKGNHTVVGWASWAGILAGTWIVAFIIAEVIPFFSDLLSLMSSLFDSFFGFIFWGTAYMRMRKADYGPGWVTKRGIRGLAGFALNVFIILIGLYMLTAGTYATVQSIIDNYHAGIVGGSFTCKSNAL
ncbi:MAG: hypothetical protein Q9200_004315 [Gallowayella weberi]